MPFVTRSGGHSEWSTIGESGIIIDLSKYHGIDIDKANRKATLKGSILSKQVGVSLAAAGFFTGRNMVTKHHLVPSSNLVLA